MKENYPENEFNSSLGISSLTLVKPLLAFRSHTKLALHKVMRWLERVDCVIHEVPCRLSSKWWWLLLSRSQPLSKIQRLCSNTLRLSPYAQGWRGRTPLEVWPAATDLTAVTSTDLAADLALSTNMFWADSRIQHSGTVLSRTALFCPLSL